ncbi:unnamed protein product [Phytomonas sp. Hart1]|nr:unnamed protein product [Phytomonas sp. Hart1]|eukprot:CCW65967.1 unnamed protein product [Phytomonas sp. isolate Hart1]
MPMKKQPSKLKPVLTPRVEQGIRSFTLSFFSGSELIGLLAIELSYIEAPKTCEMFTQYCTFQNTTEKAKNKQYLYKNCPIKRFTNTGIQTGEVTPQPKPVPIADLEAEIGRVPHHLGVLSLCRSANSFDGSQFFICLTDDVNEISYLNSSHIAFARIVEGFDVISKLKESILPYVGDDGVVDSSCQVCLSEIVAQISDRGCK